jgi:medium-chain acyl-[acyl-carrier-protein] hydrolase
MPLMKTTKHYEILCFYTDHTDKLSPQSLIGLFQDAATNQSKFLGVDYDYMQAHDMIWVLLKYNLTINRLPSFKEKIKIITYPMYYERFYVYRKFEVYDEKENLIAFAFSTWTIVDVKTKNLCKITEDLIKAYGFTNKDSFYEKIHFNNIEKIKKTDSADVSINQFKIRYMDIDHNQHVNNTKYLGWAIETVPMDIISSSHLSHVDIIYRKEIQYGQSVVVLSKTKEFYDKIEITHMITSEQEEILCQIKTVWTKATP